MSTNHLFFNNCSLINNHLGENFRLAHFLPIKGESRKSATNVKGGMMKLLYALAMIIAAISTVTAGTIQGVVTDSLGAPVQNAVVSARMDVSGGRGSGCMFRGLSASDGTFSFENVPAGNVMVRASKRLNGFAETSIIVPETGSVEAPLQLIGCRGGRGGRGPGGGWGQRRGMRCRWN
jgi:hypothetical protein